MSFLLENHVDGELRNSWDFLKGLQGPQGVEFRSFFKKNGKELPLQDGPH